MRRRVLLAERLAAVGDEASSQVTAVDNNPNFLRVAERRIADRRGDECRPRVAPVRFLQQDLDGLAAGPATYDLAWCAQSLYSFPEPIAALKKIAAALKPDGLVVVLENDTLHQLLLPWPTELELVVRSAEFAALAAESKRPGKYYVGRRLPAVFAEAGLEPLGFTTQAIDRAAPLTEPLERFLSCYLKRLRERIAPHIAADDAAEFADVASPDGARFLLRQPHFTCTWINVVAWGRKA
jgi:SAM-dependent methyltransferase